MKTMTSGERYRIGTQGQFGDPTDQELMPFAVRLLEKIGAFAMKPEQVLQQPDLREALVSEFIEEREASAIQAEADAKAKAEAEAAQKAADAKVEMDRVRQATFALMGISPEAQKRLGIVAWAKALANGEYVELPAARKHGEDDTCGAPDSVGCCDHTGKVSVWAILPNGEPPYGLCETLKSVYDELYDLSGKTARVFLHSPNRVELEAKAAYRKEKEVPVRAFVRVLATEYENQLPFIPEPKLGTDGKHLCAMGGKVPCCDGNQPAHRFPHWRGVVYGWCQNFSNAAWAEFLHIRKARDIAKAMTSEDKANEVLAKPPRYSYRLRSEETEEQAKKTAAGFLHTQAEKQSLNTKLEGIALGYARWDSEVPTPEPYGNLDGYGNILVHKCAAGKAGWGCCDGNRPVERGNAYEGVVRGFCPMSASAMFRVWQRMQKANETGSMEQAPEHLRTAEIDQAMNWAEQYNDRNRVSGMSPLGNATDPDSLRKQGRRKAAKSARSRAEYEAKPEPNNGSGDITAAFKKGKKK